MSTVLCSTGALLGMPNGRDYRLLETLSGQLDCDGFEFMMYGSWYDQVDDLLATLLSLKLYIPVVHCEKKIGEVISQGGEENVKEAFRRFEINCRIAEKLEAGKIVVHLWDGLTSDRYFANNLAAYGQLRDIAGRYGQDLLVENIVCNCEDPLKHWCELYKVYPDVHFIFDTKMAAFHDQLDLLYRDEYAWLWKEDHIRHYHVNDYAGGYKDWKNLRTLPIGKGKVDFGRFFEYIRGTGYDDTFTVESTAFDSTGAVNIGMLNEQFAYLRRMLK